jgi:hypothetical protein
VLSPSRWLHRSRGREIGGVLIYPLQAIQRQGSRARVDGRATARHLHGIIERAVRCDTVKVSAESAGAVASNVFLESLTPDKVADSHNLMVVLAHLQGVLATFRVGRHHHCGPLHEGRGLTHALTEIAPTDLLTVAAALVRKAYSKRRRLRLW